MKSLSLVVFLSVYTLAAAKFLNLYSHQQEDIQKVFSGEISKPTKNDDLNLDDVVLYLYTNSKNGTVLTSENLDNVDVKSILVFIIHGWTATINATWVKELTQAYLKEKNYNIVQVDWSKPANKTYSESAGYVDDIGNYLGSIIAKLHTNYKADLSKIQITGHSLGAQVTGAAGRAVQNLTNSKIARITGLDPARPLFEDIDLTGNGKLTKDDAELVVILHTDGGSYGYLRPAGHIDFFPNGGVSSQPGCLSEDISGTTSCSHGRSVEFFVEAVENSKDFISRQCISYLIYLSGACNNNKQVTLGADLTLEDKGNYYLRTNAESPYSKE